MKLIYVLLFCFTQLNNKYLVVIFNSRCLRGDRKESIEDKKIKKIHILIKIKAQTDVKQNMLKLRNTSCKLQKFSLVKTILRKTQMVKLDKLRKKNLL